MTTNLDDLRRKVEEAEEGFNDALTEEYKAIYARELQHARLALCSAQLEMAKEKLEQWEKDCHNPIGCKHLGDHDVKQVIAEIWGEQ